MPIPASQRPRKISLLRSRLGMACCLTWSSLVIFKPRAFRTEAIRTMSRPMMVFCLSITPGIQKKRHRPGYSSPRQWLLHPPVISQSRCPVSSRLPSRLCCLSGLVLPCHWQTLEGMKSDYCGDRRNHAHGRLRHVILIQSAALVTKLDRTSSPIIGMHHLNSRLSHILHV